MQLTLPNTSLPPDATIMSRGLLDDYQVATAMRNEAVPALERLAENDPLREHSLRRFDRDDPPPCTSSTEDDYEEEDVPPADEITRILNEPLTDKEFKLVAHRLDWQLDPGPRYNLELEFELERLDRSARDCTENTRKYFLQYGSAQDNRAGHARTNILARRNVKRRWQKLGVWNPAWGIPGREDNPLPKEDEGAWKWPWQHDDAVAETGSRRRTEGQPASAARSPRHAVIRALELRRGMRQTDHSPVIPRSHLGKDASASQAESFITSRPWFMFEVENKEMTERRFRVSTDAWRAYSNTAQPPSVAGLWMERGEWKEEWPANYRTRLIGWKWRHESPSPEPEDHTRLDDPALELTPSEIDALEAVRPPTPPPPQVYWEPPPGYTPGLFGPPPSREQVERRNRVPRPPPVRWARLCQPQQAPVEDEATSKHRGQEELAEGPPPAPRSTRKRRRQEDEGEQQPPPPRRQARRRQNRGEQAAAPPPRQKRQRRIPAAEGRPPSDHPPIRRSARVVAKNAAATALAAPAPASRRRPPPSPVSEPKPPAQAKGRPRKKARR